MTARRPRRRPALLAAGAVAALLAAAAAGGCGDETAAPRVVGVTVARAGPVPEVATGVAAGDGRVLTVAHVLGGQRSATVLGRPAAVVRVDRRTDLALLSVPGLRAPALRFGDGGGAVAVRVLRDGRPQTLRGTLRRRVVVALHELTTDRPQVRPGIELGVDVAAGDSGAPVLDHAGRVLGVVFARGRDHAGTAWAVAAPAARALLAR